MKRILFQGDSITDAGRSRDDDINKGTGYATLVSAELGFDYPNEYEFINRGVGGDRIMELYGRIKRDIINLKPDVISILIGVNDVWHEINWQNGISVKKFERIYNMMIEEIKEELPNTQIIILEPFILKGIGTVGKWEEFRSKIEANAEVSRKIADKYNLKFVPLIEKFNKAIQVAPSEYWLYDGVHPTSAGHELIKREYIKAFKEL